MPNVVTNPALPYTQTGNTCVVFTASPSTSGNVTNTGTVNANGTAANHSATGVTVSTGVSLNGSIVNQGTITANDHGVLIDQASINGAIVNSGTIAAAQVGIVVTDGGIVSGGITNTGSLSGIDLTGEGAPTTINMVGGTISGEIDLSSLGDALIITGGVVNADINGLDRSVDTVTFALGVNQTFTYSGRINGGVTTILAGGTLEIAKEVDSDVKFASAHATLQLDNVPVVTRFGTFDGLQGNIVDAVAGDAIDLRYQPFAAGDQAVWQQQNSNGETFGTLKIETSSGSVLTTLSFVGTYTSANFSLASDNHGDTLVTVVNPAPPAATTAEMIMDHPSTGDYEIYDLGQNNVLAAYQLDNGDIAAPWQVVGLGGFNGIDTADMMLHNDSTGAFEIYDVSNNALTGPVQLGAVGLAWTVAGFGDFSGHAGETDMVLRDTNADAQHPTPTGAFEVYDISNNTVTSATSLGAVGLDWQVLGFGDFSGKANETDMLMRNSNTGMVELYDISNNQVTSSSALGAIGSEWQFAGAGDFSGRPGETDLLMRDSLNGAFEVYDFQNSTITSVTALGAVGLEWSVAGVGDFSGNANETDLLLRDSQNGAFEAYDISHNAVASASAIGAVGLDWQVVGIAK